MLRVIPSTEPPDFDVRVRSRGKSFLATAAMPITNKVWRSHSYWSSAHDALYRDHKGVCMYCASWTPRSGSAKDDSSSIDHFVSREADHSLAYEWTNFRLSRRRLNTLKANHDDVIDPFQVTPDAFWLDFVRNRIVPNSNADKSLKTAVMDSISRLRLNQDPDYINERFAVYSGYAKGEFPWDEVASRFPFIASEMRRQDFDRSLAGFFV